MKKLILPICLVLIAIVGNWLFFRAERDTKEINLAHIIPSNLGQWNSEDLVLKDYVYKILGSKNVLSRRYTDKNGDVVFLSVVVSDKDRRVVHPPEVCLKGGGKKVLGKQIKHIAGLKVNQLVLASHPRNTIVWYWYALGDFFTTNYYYYQLKNLIQRILSRPKRSYLFRISFEDGLQPVAKDFVIQLAKKVKERL